MPGFQGNAEEWGFSDEEGYYMMFQVYHESMLASRSIFMSEMSKLGDKVNMQSVMDRALKSCTMGPLLVFMSRMNSMGVSDKETLEFLSKKCDDNSVFLAVSEVMNSGGTKSCLQRSV